MAPLEVGDYDRTTVDNNFVLHVYLEDGPLFLMFPRFQLSGLLYVLNILVLCFYLLAFNGKTFFLLQWNDSIDDLPEGSNANRLRLPSPKRKDISPLKKYEETKVVRRRQCKKWSLLEEDTLRTAVQRYVL